MKYISGGPFLEISFSIECEKKIKESVENIFNRIEKSIKNFKYNENDYFLAFENFITGTVYDDELTYNSFELGFIASVGRERYGILFINKVEDATFVVNLTFFGSEMDAPEWNQIGIMSSERKEFIELFKNMYERFQFSIGCIAFEEDILGFWNCDEMWPNSKYKYQYLESSGINKIPNGVISFICSQHFYEGLTLFNKSTLTERIGKNGVIVEIQKW